MSRWLMVAALVALQTGPRPAPEPPAAEAEPLPLRLAAPLAHVSSVGELPDGSLVISDARTPALLRLDPETGALSPISSAGAGRQQYVEPGGIYGGRDGELLLLDRAQARVLVIGPDGTIGRTYSIEVKGTQSASDADMDLQRLDARGYSYFTDFQAVMRTGRVTDARTPLVRFDPEAQRRETVVELAEPESRTIAHGNGVVTSRTVYGSPADGWGVTPDGRVAAVRGRPYRVDWIAPDGTITRGPETPHEILPMTEADRQAYLALAGAMPGVGVGPAGSGAGRSSLSGMDPEFAETRAPFAPSDIVVSPDAQVWVQRTRPTTATDVVYDVFDARGRRIARLAFPGSSRVVGFGAGAVYVRQNGTNGATALKKYRRP